jgi:hypothetical protein
MLKDKVEKTRHSTDLNIGYQFYEKSTHFD